MRQLHDKLRIAGGTAIATLAGAVMLLAAAIFLFVLPAIEREQVEQQRRKIHNLTDMVWSTISYFHEQELDGRLSEEEAKGRAREFVRHLRYGSDDRDYFWITDTTPRFVMHPTLPQLEGLDLSAYPTLAGRTLGEIATMVERDGEGYLDYMWPAPEDSTRMVVKTAYAKEFRPWGWVVGTGVFMDEVQRGVAHARTRVLGAALVVLVLMGGVMLVNIRQQRRMEIQRDAARVGLKESERKYEAVFENATEGIFQSTPDGDLLIANPAFARIFGYPSAEDAVDRIHDIAHQCYAHPAMRREFKERIERDGVVQYFEFTGKRVDGSHVHLMMNAHIVRDRSGRVQYYEGIIQDVTYLKHTQDQLQRLNAELERRVEERTEALARAAEELRNVSSVVLRWDPDGQVLYMNEYGLKLFKYEADELIGRNVLDTIVPPRDRSGIDLHEMIADLLREPEKYGQNDNENICKDGTRLWMAWTNKPIYDDAGALKEILTVGIDISARKRAEEEAREARNSLERALREQEAFIESISDVFYVFDEDWRLLRWNRRLVDTTGSEPSELAGCHLNDLLASEDIPSVTERLSRLEGEARIEAHILSRSGERIPHEFHTRAVEGDDTSSRYYVGIAHDLTERLAAQARMVEAEKMSALSGLVAGFLHELNTPVGVLLGSLSVVSRGVTRLSEVLEEKEASPEHVASIQRLVVDGESSAGEAADRIATILRGLKSFVNLDQATARPYDLTEGIESVLQVLDPGSRGVEVVRELDDVGLVHCYPGDINQMLMHIVSNALVAMEPGGTLTVRVRRRDEWVEIRVSDTGRGISEERLRTIFEPRFTQKTSRIGSGLGLFTCYHVVDKHGGRIRIDSRVGEGTTVSIDLPRAGGVNPGVGTAG